MRAAFPLVACAVVGLQCGPPAPGAPPGTGQKPRVVRIEVPPEAPEPPEPRVVAQIGHNLDVWAMAWSPRGDRVATGGFEHSIRIWNAQGRLLGVLVGHREALTDLELDSSGEVLASAARDGTVRLWDLHHAGKHRVLDKAGDHLAFEPGGNHVASVGYDLNVRIWRTKTGALEHVLTAPHGRQLRAVAWSPDGQRIAAAALDGQLFFWHADAESPIAQASGCGGALASVTFAPDGSTVACAGSGLAMIDTASGKARSLAVIDASPTKARFSPDGKTLASNGATGRVDLWDVATGKRAKTLTHPGYVEALAWSPRGRVLAVGGKVPSRAPDGSLIELPIARAWDADTGKQVGHFEGVARPVERAAWNAAGTLLLTAGPEVAVWDARTGARQRVLDPGGAVAAVFAPTGSMVAIASRERIRVVDADTGKEIGVVRGSELSPVWSPDGRTLAAHSLEAVQTFDVEKRRTRRLSAPGKGSLAYDVAFTADGREVAVATGTRLDFFAIDTGKLGRSLALAGHAPSWTNAERLAVGPQGHLAATLNGKGMLLWDAAGGFLGQAPDRTRHAVPAWSADGKRLAYAAEHDISIWGAPGKYLGHDHVIRSIAFAPDGERFASSSDDSTVRVWKVGSPSPLRTFATHDGRVWSVAWHPTADALLAVGNDCQIHSVRDRRTVRMIVLPAAAAAAWYTDDGKYLGDEAAARALLLRPGDDLLDPVLDGDAPGPERREDLLTGVLGMGR